jgi:hypothetical protein
MVNYTAVSHAKVRLSRTCPIGPPTSAPQQTRARGGLNVAWSGRPTSTITSLAEFWSPRGPMPMFDADWQRFHTSGGFSDRRHPLILAALSDIFPACRMA